MDKLTKDKLEILDLAYSSIAAIIEEGSREIDELEWKESIIKSDGASLEYREEVASELAMSRSYVDSWRNKLDTIENWEKEITK